MSRLCYCLRRKLGVPYSLEEHRCGYLSLIGFEPVDRYTTEYVTYKQGDARPTAIFPVTPHHNRFTALFSGTRKLLDSLVQWKINRGRHTDHPAERHSIRTNQCPPPPSPQFLQAGCPSCRPTNSVKALKASSTFGLGRRR